MTRSPRNKTLVIQPDEKDVLLSQTISIDKSCTRDILQNRIVYQDLFSCLDFLPSNFVDLLVVDPPYNLSKQFGDNKFSKTTQEKYEHWFDSWMSRIVHCLKPHASLYVCCDWQSSKPIQTILEKYFVVRNRITWEREKGRGAKSNWKNCSEDIWFCTVDKEYFFNVDAVKLKKKVIAPYKDDSGNPKDWEKTKDGNYRLTYPSNLWTDISIPFWSMPENTDHPTQKPEKLIAKLILASSQEGDCIFDPFAGSGTTCVVAKKLNRNFVGIEREGDYCCFAMKRLGEAGNLIQGYKNGCFLDRNMSYE